MKQQQIAACGVYDLNVKKTKQSLKGHSPSASLVPISSVMNLSSWALQKATLCIFCCVFKCNACHDIQTWHKILGHYNYDDGPLLCVWFVVCSP